MSTSCTAYANQDALNVVGKVPDATQVSPLDATFIRNHALVWGWNAELKPNTAGTNDQKYAIILGSDAFVQDDSSSFNALATTRQAEALKRRDSSAEYSALSIGHDARVYGTGGISLGTSAYSADGGTALGSAAFANAQAYAGGYRATATGTGSVAVGHYALSAGQQSTALGATSAAFGEGATAIGLFTKGSGNFSTSVGYQAYSGGNDSMAFGNRASVTGNNSGYFGINDTLGTITDPVSNLSVPTPNISGKKSFAMGYNDIISANNAGLIGGNTTISGDGSYSLGNKNNISTTDTFAIGNYITSTAKNSVFLGNAASFIPEGATTSGLGTYDKATINGITYAYAGGGAVGVVSVGGKTMLGTQTRRIQNMSAGLISATSTDAINGSQLYATNAVLGNLATTTASTIGGGTVVGPDGKLAPTLTVGGVKYTTVQDALNAIPLLPANPGTNVSGVVAGNNITVTKDANNNFTVSTVDNPNFTTVNANAINANAYTSGGKTYITPAGINANGQKITNVAPGRIAPDSTDAVNGAQLYAVSKGIITAGMGDVVNEINGRINQTGALNVALSGLKPIQYDPLEPTQIMAAIGGYKSENAVALGVAHYKNESTLLHAGIAANGSDIMYNMGATWKIGHRDAEESVANRYRRGPISSTYALQDEVAALKDEVAQLKTFAHQQTTGTVPTNPRVITTTPNGSIAPVLTTPPAAPAQTPMYVSASAPVTMAPTPTTIATYTPAPVVTPMYTPVAAPVQVAPSYPQANVVQVQAQPSLPAQIARGGYYAAPTSTTGSVENRLREQDQKIADLQTQLKDNTIQNQAQIIEMQKQMIAMLNKR